MRISDWSSDVGSSDLEVAAEFVGAERMLRRRLLLGVEEVDQVAVDTEPGFHQGGSGGAEREQDQEDEAADRESVAQEAAPEHLPHGERAAARGGGFGGEGAELWIRARHS